VTTPHEREQVLEQWLKQSGGARSAPTPECLDAETAAAWADGRLRGTALAEARLHAADCSRCQALMATLLRTTPQQVRAALAPTPRRWLSWAMPIAAAATIVIAGVLWVTTPAPAPSTDQVDVGPMPSVADERARRDSRLPARADRPAARAPQSPRTEVPRSELPEAATAAAAPPRTVDRMAKSSDDAEQQRFDAQPAPPTATAPPVAPPTAQSTNSLAGAGRGDPRDAASIQADGRPEIAAPNERLLTRPVAPSGSPVSVPSPNAAIQWRVNGSLVERTTDGGSTWTAPSSLPGGSITSGSAPGATVCWLVGREGTVLRTTDGTNWSRISFPEPVDLVAVGAVSAQTATVTAADGRVFATANGGQSWIR
jgi:hypothetical protein